MNRQRILTLLVAVSCALGAGVWAQTRQDPAAITASGLVLSGQAVGVRLAGPVGSDGKIPGQLVVKVDDQWVDVAFPMAVMPVTK